MKHFILVLAATALAACGSNNGNNGASNNGASNNGASNNGASNNGASNNGTASGSNNGTTAASNNGTAAASNNGTAAAPTQADLCDEFCNALGGICQAAADDFGSVEACITSCVGETDTSLEFLQCQIDAVDCDGLATCKEMF